MVSREIRDTEWSECRALVGCVRGVGHCWLRLCCVIAGNRLDRPELTLTPRVIPRAGLVRLLLLLKWLWPRLQW